MQELETDMIKGQVTRFAKVQFLMEFEVIKKSNWGNQNSRISKRQDSTMHCILVQY